MPRYLNIVFKPDEPPCTDGPPSQYFVQDGERRELSEFDMDWIEENCDIEKSIVQ